MRICNRLVEDAVYTELEVTHKGEVVARLRLRWTINAGIYGHQVVSEMWDYSKAYPYSSEVTGGCGYDKCQHAFISFLTKIFGKYRSYGGDVEYLLRGTRYHKGGNYYCIPLSTLNKLTKR